MSNYMNLSQSDSEQCELISLNDESLLNMKINTLPPKKSTEIQNILGELVGQPIKRNKILMQLCNEILSYSPTSREQYLWYLKFTATVLLLKDLPSTFCTMQGHLLTNAFSMPTALWDASPIKIHYFASGLYDIFENDFNMMFVINQIESKGPLGLYVSMVMLWKSLYRCVDEDKDIFRLYSPSNLLKITVKMNKYKLEANFEKYHLFISLFSKLVNLIFHSKLRSDEYKCCKKFFIYDVSLVRVLTMIELLQIDI